MTSATPSGRQHLVEARQKSYEHFDRSVFALSGGALALSLTFIERLTGKSAVVAPDLLYYAWVCWASSLGAVLLSHYISGKALTRAIRDFDAGKRSATPGGWISRLTEGANAVGGALFLVGIIFMVTFASKNLEVLSMNGEPVEQPSTESPCPEVPEDPGTDGYVPPPDPPPDERGYTPPPDPPANEPTGE